MIHSAIVSKIEKAHRYAQEPDRIRFESLRLHFVGDNEGHDVSLGPEGWQCTCHFFGSWATCCHVLTMQKLLGPMLPEAAQTSIFEQLEADNAAALGPGVARA